MSLFAVTIPQKELVVNFNINDVKTALSKLPKMLDNCTILSQDDVLNKVDLQLTSFMSLGNKLSITLTKIDENTTKLVIDTSRMIGTFNESHEVSSANTDYTKMTTALSTLLSNPNITDDEIQKYNQKTSNSGVNAILYVIFIILLIYIFSR